MTIKIKYVGNDENSSHFTTNQEYYVLSLYDNGGNSRAYVVSDDNRIRTTMDIVPTRWIIVSAIGSIQIYP